MSVPFWPTPSQGFLFGGDPDCKAVACRVAAGQPGSVFPCCATATKAPTMVGGAPTLPELPKQAVRRWSQLFLSLKVKWEAMYRGKRWLNSQAMANCVDNVQSYLFGTIFDGKEINDQPLA